jgi:hypothetical protein
MSTAEESAGQKGFHETSQPAHGELSEDSLPGSKILDPGSFPTGRPAPAPARSPADISAADLAAEYAADCAHRPPGEVLGQLERQVGGLLNEGFEPGVLRTALDRLRAKGLHPRTLPSLVNEIVNAPNDSGFGRGRPGPGPVSAPGAHVPYFNPAPPTGVFGIPMEPPSG